MELIATNTRDFAKLRQRAKDEKQKKLEAKILIRDLPMVYGLFSIGISSGVPIQAVIREISNYSPQSCQEDIRSVVKELDAGRSIQNSMVQLEDHPQFRTLAHVIAESSDCGTDILPTLDSLHKDSMSKIRREAETAIKKLPITMLFPLVACILPAFMLLSVAPTLIDGFMHMGF
jgi:pilus assembly protein TadC